MPSSSGRAVWPLTPPSRPTAAPPPSRRATVAPPPSAVVVPRPIAPVAGTQPLADRLLGLCLLVALAALYVPTVVRLAQGLWTTSAGAHGPIVLALVLWLFVAKWRDVPAELKAQARPAPAVGAPLVAAGLALYLLGRTQSMPIVEVASALALVPGCVLVLCGTAVTRRMWFAFFFLAFLVPLPGSLVDAITQPMKLAVSWAAEESMHLLGYPTARAGVAITIGQYQLLVADACAGLNSLFVLEGLGLFYMNLMRHPSVLRTVTLGVLIVPISFVSNVVRVLVLALLTYHGGDAVGQGFLHSFSGMVLFGCALLLTLSLDGALRSLAAALARRRRAPAGPEAA